MKRSLVSMGLIISMFGALMPVSLAQFEVEFVTDEIVGEYVEGEVLVKFKEDTSARAIRSMDVESSFDDLDIALVKAEEGETTLELMQRLEQNSNVEYVEPNYIRTIDAVFDDTFFEEQWYLNNTGQTVNEIAGTADADIDFSEAMDTLVQTDEIVVAVLDSGIRLTHNDLQANKWDGSVECYDEDNVLIEGGCPNSGWDFRNEDNDPTDDHGHGTFVAGIIGATTNNTAGMVGIAGNVKIMSVKFIGSGGTGNVADY